MHTDRAYPVVVAGRTLFFGNNVDNHVYALDTRTGSERWSFAADGSVRFAPVVDGGRLFFGSDDGQVYCLNASDGSLVWKHRPSPSGERVIGNGRMISLWPIRTGLLLEGGPCISPPGFSRTRGYTWRRWRRRPGGRSG